MLEIMGEYRLACPDGWSISFLVFYIEQMGMEILTHKDTHESWNTIAQLMLAGF